MTVLEEGSSPEHTTNQKGAIAEEVIAAEATKLGVIVSRPNIDARYDLIFDTGSSLLRVQCKWGRLDAHEGVIKVNLVSSWCIPSGYARSTYKAGEVDLFAVYCHELNRCYLLEADALVDRRTMYLRLSEPRNAQRACVNLASDFTFEGAVAQLEERCAGSAQVRGSSPLSSTSSARSEVIRANEFRNRFGWYMERAAAGEVFEITRHGRPFVRVTPAELRLNDLAVPAAAPAASAAA
jgi:prevent-host-death family protein